MDWRGFFGLAKILGEDDLLKIEINKIREARKQILICGYDDKIFGSDEYISALKLSVGRGVKVGVILHERDPLTKLEELVKQFGNIEIYRSKRGHLTYHGFRAYDKYFGVSYNKKSQCLAEGDTTYHREYLDNTNNLFLRIFYNCELRHTLNKQSDY